MLPGYGITLQDGFEDVHLKHFFSSPPDTTVRQVFTSNAMAALEVGAMPYARGLIDNQYRNYIRKDGQINYRAEETAQQARMLTILALYHSYSTQDDEFLLSHYEKAKGIADWLIARRALTLQLPMTDPRYGMIPGNEEGDEFVHYYFHQAKYSHWYELLSTNLETVELATDTHADYVHTKKGLLSCSVFCRYSAVAEAYRAFEQLGPVWTTIGAKANRSDVSVHGAQLSQLAPLLYQDLHSSMNKTANTSVPGQVCYPDQADPGKCCGCIFRSYSELFYSGALTAEQTESMYLSGLGVTNCGAGR